MQRISSHKCCKSISIKYSGHTFEYSRKIKNFLILISKSGLLLSGILLWPIGIFADTIYLKNGKSLDGRIISQTRMTVKIRWDDGGNQVFQKSTIQQI